MGRPRSIFNAMFPIQSVIGVCSVDPKITEQLKMLSHTGKRGRPSIRVDGRQVVKLLNKHNAKVALKFFTEHAEAAAAH